MKNTVIANRKKGDWEIIKKYFENRGYKNFMWNGNSIGNYYGVIEDSFGLYYLSEIEEANATILEVSDIDKEFKVGDVVVVTQKHYETGKVSEITCKYKDDDRYFNLKDCKHPYKPSQMRHATPEEIKQYKGISDTVTLPKSFVLEAHKEACSDWKKRIEEVVPELFVKNELIVGKWYKRGMELLVWNGGKSTYGFNMDGSWMDSMCFTKLSVNTEPATEQEVYDALKNEAVKRGFKSGNFKCLEDGNIWSYDSKEGWTYFENGNYLMWDAGVCFEKGKWAEIISDPIPQELESLISKLGKDKILEYLKD